MKQKIFSFIIKLFGFFAKIYLKRYNPFVIGVTGSIGKTTVRDIVYQILKKYGFKVYSSGKNFNGEYGMILSIFQIEEYGILKNLLKVLLKTFFGKKEYDIIILEYGIDHPGEMDYLLSIVKPDISITTGIDKIHLKNFEDFDQLIKEKQKLALNTKKVVFLNYNDDNLINLYDSIKVDKFLFAISDYENPDKLNLRYKPDIYFSDYNIFFENGRIFSKARGFIKENFYNIKSNLVGKENIGYILVGLAILKILYFYFNKKDISLYNELEFNFELKPGRFSIFKGINGSIIIDSTYNAGPKSMKRVIENVYNLKQNIFKDYKIILALGDMRELGSFSEQEHRKLAGFVSQVADEVYTVGENMKKFFHDELDKIGFSGYKQYFEHSKKLGKFLKEKISKENGKSIILFKGSQNTIFLEEAVKFLLQDEKDFLKLPRQNKKWLKIKETFFKSE